MRKIVTYNITKDTIIVEDDQKSKAVVTLNPFGENPFPISIKHISVDSQIKLLVKTEFLQLMKVGNRVHILDGKIRDINPLTQFGDELVGSTRALANNIAVASSIGLFQFSLNPLKNLKEDSFAEIIADVGSFIAAGLVGLRDEKQCKPITDYFQAPYYASSIHEMYGLDKDSCDILSGLILADFKGEILGMTKENPNSLIFGYIAHYLNLLEEYPKFRDFRYLLYSVTMGTRATLGMLESIHHRIKDEDEDYSDD